MLYAPWPEGPVAAAFVFFLLAPPVPMRRAEMSRGGPTKWGAQRPLTSEPGALHCAACAGGKKRRSNLTGCKFSVAQMRLASAPRESYSIRREWCAEKNVWDSEPVCGTAMRVSAIFSRPCAADALTAQVSVF